MGMADTAPTVQAFTNRAGHRVYTADGHHFATASPIGDGRYRVRPFGETTGPVVATFDRADVIAARWAAEGVR